MDRFKKAIEEIKNDNIRNLTRDALTAVSADNPWFFYAPASTSGKYHPEDENARGGLVRHTLRAVELGRHLSRAWALDPDQEDAVAAALILHDTGKRPPDPAAPYDHHPDRAADNLLAVLFTTTDNSAYTAAVARYSRDEIAMITAIDSAIRHHMGPWTREEIRMPVDRYSETERAVYTADFIASRRALDAALKAA